MADSRISASQDLTGKVTKASVHAVAGGAFSDVWLGDYNGRSVAIKVPRIVNVSAEKLTQRIRRELESWAYANHPNVLPLLGYCTNFGSAPSFISPWMAYGTVSDYLEDHADGDRIKIIEGLASGLSYLHKIPIVHGDLRGTNVLVSAQGEPCISDFGLSHHIGNITPSTVPHGSLRWKAPELHDPEMFGLSVDEAQGVACDVWSFGMTVLELITGEWPYVEVQSEHMVVVAVLAKRLPNKPTSSKIKEPTSEELWSLCGQCWDFEPKSRISMREVCRTLELNSLRQRALAMGSLQKELDELRETNKREKERAASQAKDHEEELRILRERCEAIKQESVNREREREKEIALFHSREHEEELRILRERCEKLEQESTSHDRDDVIKQLRNGMAGLLTELGTLSQCKDELKEYKRKYEQAKTELRSMKESPHLIVQASKLDDKLRGASDGCFLDVHIAAFFFAIDSLLTAGRSNAPTKVLSPMKAVVNAVTAINADVEAYERRPAEEHPEVDSTVLRSLRDRLEVTLRNLVTVSTVYATSFGTSPISLLEAAAGDISAAVTEIDKTVRVKKDTKIKHEGTFPSAPAPSTSSTTTHNGYSSALRSVGDSRLRQRKSPHSTPSRLRAVRTKSLPQRHSSPIVTNFLQSRSQDSQPVSRASSPLPKFNETPASTNAAADPAGRNPDDPWSVLRPQLEALESAIQGVISDVHYATPSLTLKGNLTHIILIVTSIVAVCKDTVPAASAEQGNEILRELSDLTKKLSEVQALHDVTTESRQAMADLSFGVAEAMKRFMKL